MGLPLLTTGNHWFGNSMTLTEILIVSGWEGVRCFFGWQTADAAAAAAGAGRLLPAHNLKGETSIDAPIDATHDEFCCLWPQFGSHHSIRCSPSFALKCTFCPRSHSFTEQSGLENVLTLDQRLILGDCCDGGKIISADGFPE